MGPRWTARTAQLAVLSTTSSLAPLAPSTWAQASPPGLSSPWGYPFKVWRFKNFRRKGRKRCGQPRKEVIQAVFLQARLQGGSGHDGRYTQSIKVVSRKRLALKTDE